MLYLPTWRDPERPANLIISQVRKARPGEEWALNQLSQHLPEWNPSPWIVSARSSCVGRVTLSHPAPCLAAPGGWLIHFFHLTCPRRTPDSSHPRPLVPPPSTRSQWNPPSSRPPKPSSHTWRLSFSHCPVQFTAKSCGSPLKTSPAFVCFSPLGWREGSTGATNWILWLHPSSPSVFSPHSNNRSGISKP